MKDYQIRLASIIEDFGAPQGGEAAPAAEPERYRGRVPDAVIEFWQQNGTGIILDGYFQFCDPDMYAPIMKLVFDGDSEIEAGKTHVLGFGAFGKMIAWNETHQDMIIDLVKGMVSCPALTSGEKFDENIAVTSQLMTLDQAFLDEYDANAKKLFKSARSRIGKLRVGQIYGFKPILALGGNRSLDSLTIYEALPHMAILAQAHGMQLMDNASFPPKAVRAIGS
ncbi:hypothetical protein EV128_106224 [Rhizobium azibense]|nr:hypothetical protein EV128_106224 [Rhizobium azibense]